MPSFMVDTRWIVDVKVGRFDAIPENLGGLSYLEIREKTVCSYVLRKFGILKL